MTVATGSVGMSTGPLRQGVSMHRNEHRFQDIQPKIWAGDLSHEHPQITFGIENLWADYTPFNDRRFDLDINRTIAHFQSSSVSITEAFSSAGDDDGDIELLNGVIEPLEIRTTLPSFTPFINERIVRAEYGEGSRGDPIFQYTVVDEITLVEPFVERGTVTLQMTASYTSTSGITSGSVVSRPELLRLLSAPQVEPEEVASSFDDSAAITPSLPKSYITPERQHFAVALQNLTSSTDVFELEGKRYAGTGIQYHTSQYGTDSIAFGGLMRYKVPT